MTDAKTITLKLGGDWRHGAGQAACPKCQPEGRKDQRALSASEANGRLLLNCFKAHCSFSDIVTALGIQGTIRPSLYVTKSRSENGANLQKARGLWDRAKPISGTKGETYLRSRGITCDLPETLRFIPDVYYPKSGKFCAVMVADVCTGGVHRTFLDKRTGAKIPNNAKMMLGPCSGGAVCLSDGQGPLLVCEGIETGLSLLSGSHGGGASVWAALSTSGLRRIELPPQAGRLVIATDGDDAGREAGDVLGNRAKAMGWDVEFHPAPMGYDWNDVLVGKVAA